MTDSSDQEAIWNLSNIAPSDWVGVLKIDLRLSGIPTTNKACCAWLNDRNVSANSIDLSKLRAQMSSDSKLSPKLYSIVQAIRSGVSVRSLIKYFEDLAYRSLKFFMPLGNPLKLSSGRVPMGLYEASRYSFSDPGMVVKSAFLFYRNRQKDELLAGYSDGTDYAAETEKSSVCRFKEFRKISKPSNGGYQIIVGGFVFYNRNSFYLVGAAIETAVGKNEQELTLPDVRHIQPALYILDDDNDIDVVRGIKTTSLRNEGDPAAAVIEMKRVAGATDGDWRNISNEDLERVGVVSADHPSVDASRLRPNISSEFKMLRVNRRK